MSSWQPRGFYGAWESATRSVPGRLLRNPPLHTRHPRRDPSRSPQLRGTVPPRTTASAFAGSRLRTQRACASRTSTATSAIFGGPHVASGTARVLDLVGSPALRRPVVRRRRPRSGRARSSGTTSRMWSRARGPASSPAMTRSSTQEGVRERGLADVLASRHRGLQWLDFVIRLLNFVRTFFGQAKSQSFLTSQLVDSYCNIRQSFAMFCR